MDQVFSAQAFPILAALSATHGVRSFAVERDGFDIDLDSKILFEIHQIMGNTAFPKSKTMEVNYRDYDGQINRREIDIKCAYKFNKSFYIDAECWLRGGIRSFKLDNISTFKLEDKMFIDDIKLSKDIDDSDFFIHPKKWGQFRKSAMFLRQHTIKRSASKQDTFEIVARFIWNCLSAGYWSDFATPQQAVGAALLAETFIAETVPDWDITEAELMIGKAPKSVFFGALASISEFRNAHEQ
ncbi:WYL domain-containing protein [Sphingobium sp. KCTC 72723]|uniref:WYL domain-containing protein n=1 Tax=Sphingobium sp. KCTC 72723 TaxID=2733867 RepID=UPI001CB746BB|nr:WYL domain-containing protein [Sphingobium sp. KCTC 72723]